MLKIISQRMPGGMGYSGRGMGYPGRGSRLPKTPPTPGQAGRATERLLTDVFEGNVGNLVEGPAKRVQQSVARNQWLNQNKDSLVQGACAVCGTAGKCAKDTENLAGRGRGALLCPQHAIESGVSTKTAEFSPATLNKMRSREPKTEPTTPAPRSNQPNPVEVFWGAMDTPIGMSAEEWRSRYYDRGLEFPKPNSWATRALRKFFPRVPGRRRNRFTPKVR